MINGKRLLFGMLAGTLLGRRARRVGRGFGGAGMGMRGGKMGLLGVAALMAARHFMQQRGPSSPRPGGGAAGGTGGTGGGPNIGGIDLGSLFGMGAAGGGGGAAPQHAVAATAQDVPLDTPPTPAEAEEAMTLIRAMVAAAQADGKVDPEERRRIVDGLTEAGAEPEERDFILAELDRPHDFDAIVKAVRTREMAEEVYGAALLAIEVDTEAERWFLRNLAARLNLDDAAVADLHERFETPRP